MKLIHTTGAVIALALAALTARPGELLAQQMYECVTTTTRTTVKIYYTDGTYEILTWSDSVTKCSPITQT
mgnify:CR=1 FL=1